MLIAPKFGKCSVDDSTRVTAKLGPWMLTPTQPPSSNSTKKFNNSTRKGLVSWPSNPRIYSQEQDCTFCRLCLPFASCVASAKESLFIVRLRRLRQSHPTTSYSRAVARERHPLRHQGCLQNRNVVFSCYRHLLPAPRCLERDTL